MEAMIGGAVAGFAVLALFLIGWGLLLPVTYVVLRWRFDAEEGFGPRHFGLQCVLWVLMSLGIQTLVLSATLLLYALLEDPGDDFMQLTMGLLIGSVVVVGALGALVRFTVETHPRITRTYLGLNLFYVGSSATFSVLAFFVVLLQDNVPDAAFSLTLSMLIGYLVGAGVLAMLVRRANQAMLGTGGGGGVSGGGRTQAMGAI